MGQLHNRVAVITGGSSGIGLATAKRFVEEGAFVFILGRRQAELDKAVAAVGSNIVAVRGDVSNQADLDRLYAVVKERKGKLDIVVANAAALVGVAPLGQITEELIDRQFGVNVKGLIFTVQKALPLLADGSSVILLSSIGANKGIPGQSVYASTKAAVRSLARTWILELKPRKIRVNVLSPGSVDTPGVAEVLGSEEVRKTVIAHLSELTPVGRVGAAADIANVAVFVASEGASYMNGADIQVDGGFAQI